MNKYEIRTQEKKNAIIAAALELFRKKGFVAVSIKEIAALANVSQVSIYNYYNSKDALVKECTNRLMKETLQKARNLLPCKMEYKEKLLKAFSLGSDSTFQSLFDYFSTEALDDKVFLHLCTESIDEQLAEIFRDYIELGKQEGAIDDSISTSTILEYMEAINTAKSKLGPAEIMKTREYEFQKLLLYGLIGNVGSQC
jgi:AcrR family transcriptional regulator